MSAIRRRILSDLLKRKSLERVSMRRIAIQVEVDTQTVRRHLKALQAAGIITLEAAGRTIPYSIKLVDRHKAMRYVKFP